MGKIKQSSVTRWATDLRENNARRYSQYLLKEKKKDQCKRLKNDLIANRTTLEKLKTKLKGTKNIDRIRKKASASLQTVSEFMQNDKSCIKSGILLQKTAIEKRKNRNEKLLHNIDKRIKKFMEYYNCRPSISKINNLHVTCELLVKETEDKASFIMRAKAEIKEHEEEFVEVTVTLAEVFLRHQKSLKTVERQCQMKKRMAELEKKILELRIMEAPEKKSYQRNFYADVDWTEYEDIQSVQPMSVASPDTTITPFQEQGPLSCLSLDFTSVSPPGDKLPTVVEVDGPPQVQPAFPSTLETAPSTNSNHAIQIVESANIDPDNIDTDAIINEPPTSSYFYNTTGYDSSVLYSKSPDPPQSVGSVDFAHLYAKSPEPQHRSSSEPTPPTPPVADTRLPNFFNRKEENSDRNTAGMFFNFAASSQEVGSTFYNLF